MEGGEALRVFVVSTVQGHFLPLFGLIRGRWDGGGWGVVRWCNVQHSACLQHGLEEGDAAGPEVSSPPSELLGTGVAATPALSGAYTGLIHSNVTWSRWDSPPPRGQ